MRAVASVASVAGDAEEQRGHDRVKNAQCDDDRMNDAYDVCARCDAMNPPDSNVWRARTVPNVIAQRTRRIWMMARWSMGCQGRGWSSLVRHAGRVPSFNARMAAFPRGRGWREIQAHRVGQQLGAPPT